jgi:hypothetical protein
MLQVITIFTERNNKAGEKTEESSQRGGRWIESERMRESSFVHRIDDDHDTNYQEECFDW